MNCFIAWTVCFYFQFYLVMKGQGKHDSSDPAIERSRQNGGNKFVQSKVRMMSQQHTAQPPQAGSALDQSGPRGQATATEPLAGI